MVGSCTLYGNLYFLNLHSSYAQSLLPFRVDDGVNDKRKRINENSFMLWHKHLGHISQ